MGMIGNTPYQGLIGSGNLQDGAVTTSKVADSALTAAKLAAAAVTDKLGYTPVNKAGDTVSGNLNFSVATGKQISIAQWADLSGGDGGQGIFAGNAYIDKTGGQIKYSNSHGSIGAVGISLNSPGWNSGALFTSPGNAATANQAFTPKNSLVWDSSGQVTTPYQPAFVAHVGLQIAWASLPNGVMAGTKKLAFASPTKNVGSCWNTTTHKFTAPVAGFYHAACHLIPYTLPTNNRVELWISLQDNSTRIFLDRALKSQAQASNTFSLGGATVVWLNAGETLHFEAYPDGQYDQEASCSASIYLLG